MSRPFTVFKEYLRNIKSQRLAFAMETIFYHLSSAHLAKNSVNF